jgi:S-adenosylmethionine decarboxylase
MLDLRECDQEKLSDYNLVFSILSDLPDKIGMTKITQPYVFPYEGLVPEDKGITGTVIIAESHISIHTFQEKDYCFVDVFSCKDFDVDYAAEYIIRAFESKIYDKHIINRGKDFVRSAQPQEAAVV